MNLRNLCALFQRCWLHYATYRIVFEFIFAKWYTLGILVWMFLTRILVSVAVGLIVTISTIVVCICSIKTKHKNNNNKWPKDWNNKKTKRNETKRNYKNKYIFGYTNVQRHSLAHAYAHDCSCIIPATKICMHHDGANALLSVLCSVLDIYTTPYNM